MLMFISHLEKRLLTFLEIKNTFLMEISSIKMHSKLQKIWKNIEGNKEKSGKHKLLLD